jgi:hypothetical protein
MQGFPAGRTHFLRRLSYGFGHCGASLLLSVVSGSVEESPIPAVARPGMRALRVWPVTMRFHRHAQKRLDFSHCGHVVTMGSISQNRVAARCCRARPATLFALSSTCVEAGNGGQDDPWNIEGRRHSRIAHGVSRRRIRGRSNRRAAARKRARPDLSGSGSVARVY